MRRSCHAGFIGPAFVGPGRIFGKTRDVILYHRKQCVLHESTPSRAILLGYETRGWASSKISNPLSLKVNLDPIGLANAVSNPVSNQCCYATLAPRRIRTYNLLIASLESYPLCHCGTPFAINFKIK